MSTTIQLLRSDIPQQRPDPGVLANGVPMVNINEQEPGLFFAARDGSLVKIGPASISQFPPNSEPQGEPGNCIGELWIDTSGASPDLKFFDGSAFQSAFTAPQSVTSIGLSFSDVFSVSNSPVTSSGTLTATLLQQTANTVFAGPASGSGVPSFRSLEAADVPTLSASKISSGVFDSGRIPSLDASKITSGVLSTSRLPDPQAKTYTVTGLPTATLGKIACVNDANAPVLGNTVVGGGASTALCWYNGLNWTIIGV